MLCTIFISVFLMIKSLFLTHNIKKMKIFTSKQIRECDHFTIQREPVSSITLMERAAEECSNWLANHIQNHTRFLIFCGNGNNGGDGFAISRLLYQKGFDVEVFIDTDNYVYLDDAKLNFNQVKDISGIEIKDFDEAHNINFSKNDVIIDAFFGSGLNRNIEGKTSELIKLLNKIEARKISIDIPSGLFADVNINPNSIVFKADHTLSFQFWKQSFLHPETGIFTGKIHLLNIGLSEEYIQNTPTHQYIICETLIQNIYKPRNEFSHKGSYGKTCIIGGSFGKIGAAVLATKAALKAGSGLTFTLAPKCGYEVLQSSCPEAMYLYGGEDFISNFEIEKNMVCGIGPGLGTDPQTEAVFFNFLQLYNQPVVLDADALNLISKHPENLNLIPKNSIITPHPKEFERLFGKTENSFERLILAQNKAKNLGIFIVLKDHHTQIITPEGLVYYNITGNSGMAKGGSGDVLTGIITSLLSQNYSSQEAAIFGVWLHGKAGDLASEKHSKEAMLPFDLINELGNVFKMLKA